MWRSCVFVICLAGPAAADAPDTSIFPRARPAVVAEAVETALAAATVPLAEAPAAETSAIAAIRPRARPVTAISTASAPAPRERRGFLVSLFGPPRARPQTEEAAPRPSGNSVCGDPAIIGQVLEPIGSRTRGCGIDEPVQITSVDGITLSQPATLDCNTATALHRWIDDGLRPAFGDTRVAGLQIAGHYVCRTRNNIRGAPVSEHGRGKAIDISGIILEGGRVLTVEGNWNSAMRAAYRAGCGVFGTTLGPGSDGYHEDHMHFDTASHRSGAYCR